MLDDDLERNAKTWWQLDKSTEDFPVRVWLNKPKGPSAGLWVFEPQRDDQHVEVLRVTRHRWDDLGTETEIDQEWEIPMVLPSNALPAVLAGLVGLRSAAGVVRRLRLPQ